MNAVASDFTRRLAAVAADTEALLERLLAAAPAPARSRARRG